MVRKTAFCLLLGSALLALPAVAEDLTVDDVVAKFLEARGGTEAWTAVQSARMTGVMSMPSMGVEAPIMMEFKRPNKIRMEMTMQGMEMIQAYDGSTGWAIMPMLGSTDPQEMPEDQLKQLLDMADFDGPLVNYQDKGHQVELLGKADVDGTETYKLKLTKKNGDVVYSYLDTEYFMEIRQEGRANVQGTEMDTAQEIGDYKEVAGLVVPHSIAVSLGGGPTMQSITIDKIELDVELADDRFAMPAVEPAGADSAESGE